MSMKPAFERRQFGRRESTIRAVAYVVGRPAAHCVVKNFSPRGAMLEFDEPFAPTFHFRLVIDAWRLELECEVRHQGDRQVGITFLSGKDMARTARSTTRQELAAIERYIQRGSRTAY